MDFRQFRCLVAIVDEGSFSGAGRRLGMSQPAVSLQIQRLESGLGEPVFFREGRRVRLTAVGEALLPHARTAMRAFQDARVAVEHSRGAISGSILFGTVPGCGGVGVPGLLKAFQESYPHVSMTLRESSAEELIRLVRHGELDIAIVGTASPPEHGLQSRTIVESNMVAVVAKVHELAAHRTMSLREVLAYEVMCTPKGSGIRAALDAVRKQEGLDLTVSHESGNPDMLVQFASLGLGIAIVPDDVSIRNRDDVAVVTITDPEVTGLLELAWTRQSETSPAVRELIRLAAML